METPITGHQVGQYVLEEKLGEGGMAEVWRARNIVLGNSVAIKFLAQGFAGRPDVEQRFLGEGKRQANLQHSNIVSAFDFLYVDGRSFLVMKYIKGESLDHRLFKLQTSMPLPAVISISKDVLSALDYAHTEGVVHRDIKPSNILLETSGRAYVMDFGIALFMREQRVTRAGTAIGTPHYMSPEQIIGSKDLDHRSDIYSYGCVLYQMLTQFPPFDFNEEQGDTEYAVKEQHMRQQARPLRELNPSVPEYIEQIVMRCLEKKPADRYQTCHELMEALSQPAPSPQWQQPAGMPARPRTIIEGPDAAAWSAAGAGMAAGATAYPTAPPMTPRTTLESGPGPGTMPPRTTVEPAYQSAVPPVNQQAPVYQPPPPAKSGGQTMILALAGVLALAGAGGGYYYWSSHKTETKPTPPVVESKDTSTTATTSTGSQASRTDTLPPDGGKIRRDSRKQTPTADHTRTTATLDTEVRGPKSGPGQETGAETGGPKPGAGGAPPPPPPPLRQATSGTLVCSTMGTSRHGKQGYLFTSLPQHISFVDPVGFQSRWIFDVVKKYDATNTQDVVLIPKTPQMPASCSEPWYIKAP
jgi:serine/threonine-protein kinase